MEDHARSAQANTTHWIDGGYSVSLSNHSTVVQKSRRLTLLRLLIT
jgi:hypothetical protein